MTAQTEAIATADAHLSNAGLPTYTEVLEALRVCAAQSTGPDWTPAQALEFVKSHTRFVLARAAGL